MFVGLNYCTLTQFRENNSLESELRSKTFIRSIPFLNIDFDANYILIEEAKIKFKGPLLFLTLCKSNSNIENKTNVWIANL